MNEMGLASTFGTPGILSGAISPYREAGAYEALWREPQASFRWIADKFRKHPTALPSDFVSEQVAFSHAAKMRAIFKRAGVEDYGIRVRETAEYPDALRTAEHSLAVLYFQGWWDLVNSDCVAIIGTREPSEEGKARARRLTKNFLTAGWTVVSGLASGIDTVVHNTVLAEEGRTIAVLGTPLTAQYPRENATLQRTLAAEQLVISQVPVIRYYSAPDPTANSFFFSERNITMSALSAATIIVEAGERSGTLVQARHALKQGKPVFVLDSNFRNPALTWPARLEGQGAIRVRAFEEIKEGVEIYRQTRGGSPWTD